MLFIFKRNEMEADYNKDGRKLGEMNDVYLELFSLSYHPSHHNHVLLLPFRLLHYHSSALKLLFRDLSHFHISISRIEIHNIFQHFRTVNLSYPNK